MSKKMSALHNEQSLWQTFAQQHALSQKQLEQFQAYYNLLIQTNKLYNLTTITKLKNVLNVHFSDSLALDKIINIRHVQALADIGSGGGFPGIPLKIKYPEIQVTLIEVKHKKKQFLTSVIELLGLTEIDVSGLDWRTFVRSTNKQIDLFCARASLQPIELIRCLRPASAYKDASIVYWASKGWEATESVTPFIKKQVSYKIARKTRQLVLFAN